MISFSCIAQNEATLGYMQSVYVYPAHKSSEFCVSSVFIVMSQTLNLTDQFHQDSAVF